MIMICLSVTINLIVQIIREIYVFFKSMMHYKSSHDQI